VAQRIVNFRFPFAKLRAMSKASFARSFKKEPKPALPIIRTFLMSRAAAASPGTQSPHRRPQRPRKSHHRIREAGRLRYAAGQLAGE